MEHMQGMKYDLQQQISRLDMKVDNLERKVDEGFEDARLHRQALQEDLDVSIAMLGRHQEKLQKITV